MPQTFLDHCLGKRGASLDLLFADVPVFLIAADRDWVILRASRHLADALGTTDAALTGRPFAEILAPESRDRHRVDLAPQFAASGRIAGAEIDLLGADGSDLQVVMEAGLCGAGAGKPAAASDILAVLHDDTEARAARKALAQAAREAREASLAKSRLLAAMGHEIRTPVNVILGFARLLKMSGLDEARLAHVAAIESAGRALMDLLGDLLDLSQIEAGHLKIDPQPFALDDFLAQIDDWWQVQAAAKGLAFAIDRDPRLPALLIGDRARIRQVLNNLLGNAIKFTDAGSVTLSVRQAAGEDDRQRLSFSVSDTGPGFSPDEAAQLFRPFVQGGRSGNGDRIGWGLGLSICREIADAMNAELGVEASPGKGATFRFELDLGRGFPDP